MHCQVSRQSSRSFLSVLMAIVCDLDRDVWVRVRVDMAA